MKYYLLTFNDDWADEHDVPALACMTEEEYNEWLETPSGNLNPDYEEQKKVWDETQLKYKNYCEELNKRNLWCKRFDEYTTEEKEWYESNKVEYPHRNYPIRCKSNMHARLGNGGDCFDESYTDKYLMKEFVEDNTVKVMEVEEFFYNTFHKAGLANLSLCNVFEINDY